MQRSLSDRAGPRRDAQPARSPGAEHHLLALQRGAGNQAVLRMLVARKEPPTTRLGETPVTEPQLYGETDATEWATQVRAGTLLPLYAEVAKLVQADKVPDVAATGGRVNPAMRSEYGDLKQGLNFVRGVRGQCGYLYDSKFDSTLPVKRKGPLPEVAVVLGKLAFEPDNKSFTLGVLRHELEHALHNRLAVDWLRRWREDEKASTKDFTVWLDKQPMSAADRELVKERVTGVKDNTETLANLEGFMAAFAVERPGVQLADHPATEELDDAADYWLRADKGVQDEARNRLRDYGSRLTGERLTTFRAALQSLKARKAALAALVDPLLKPR